MGALFSLLSTQNKKVNHYIYVKDCEKRKLGGIRFPMNDITDIKITLPILKLDDVMQKYTYIPNREILENINLTNAFYDDNRQNLHHQGVQAAAVACQADLSKEFLGEKIEEKNMGHHFEAPETVPPNMMEVSTQVEPLELSKKEDQLPPSDENELVYLTDNIDPFSLTIIIKYTPNKYPKLLDTNRNDVSSLGEQLFTVAERAIYAYTQKMAIDEIILPGSVNPKLDVFYKKFVNNFRKVTDQLVHKVKSNLNLKYLKKTFGKEIPECMSSSFDRQLGMINDEYKGSSESVVSDSSDSSEDSVSKSNIQGEIQVDSKVEGSTQTHEDVESTESTRANFKRALSDTKNSKSSTVTKSGKGLTSHLCTTANLPIKPKSIKDNSNVSLPISSRPIGARKRVLSEGSNSEVVPNLNKNTSKSSDLSDLYTLTLSDFPSDRADPFNKPLEKETKIPENIETEIIDQNAIDTCSTDLAEVDSMFQYTSNLNVTLSPTKPTEKLKHSRRSWEKLISDDPPSVVKAQFDEVASESEEEASEAEEEASEVEAEAGDYQVQYIEAKVETSEQSVEITESSANDPNPTGKQIRATFFQGVQKLVGPEILKQFSDPKFVTSSLSTQTEACEQRQYREQQQILDDSTISSITPLKITKKEAIIQNEPQELLESSPAAEAELSADHSSIDPDLKKYFSYTPENANLSQSKEEKSMLIASHADTDVSLKPTKSPSNVENPTYSGSPKRKKIIKREQKQSPSSVTSCETEQISPEQSTKTPTPDKMTVLKESPCEGEEPVVEPSVIDPAKEPTLSVSDNYFQKMKELKSKRDKKLTKRQKEELRQSINGMCTSKNKSPRKRTTKKKTPFESHYVEASISAIDLNSSMEQFDRQIYKIEKLIKEHNKEVEENRITLNDESINKFKSEIHIILSTNYDTTASDTSGPSEETVV